MKEEGGGVIGGEPVPWLPDGESDRGVDILLGLLEPYVAAMEGDEGGCGDRVKYTTLARDPPTCRERKS